MAGQIQYAIEGQEHVRGRLGDVVYVPRSPITRRDSMAPPPPAGWP